jgi:hypothetical protein
MRSFDEMISSKFGVTLVLPECAFAAELQRDSLPEMMKDIDERLTEQGAPEDARERCEMMMDNLFALSSMLANHEIDHTAGVADIAYSFVYAFGKAIGFEQMDHLRGLTGTFLGSHSNFNPCLGEDEYERETAILQQKMADLDSGEWYPDPPPTLH